MIDKNHNVVKSHKIYARHSTTVNPKDRLSIPLIKRVVLGVLRIQGVEIPCEISVLITDERTIRKLNLEYRGSDTSTDVLSFPMQELSPMQSVTLDGWESIEPDIIDPDTGLLPLGEIVLCSTITAQQAQEFGISKEQETAYLIIHSVLHLLGYDHEDEGDDKKEMRAKEKVILKELNL
jgi:probable rRNA maturation factor